MLCNQIRRQNVLKSFKFSYSISSRLLQDGKVDERQRKMMEKGLPKKKPIEGVQNVVLVVSGKGGVGKSTTSVNLAAAMALQNAEVGLLDADVFGPSVPLMMKLNDSPLLNKDNKMIPLTNYGVKCMSMGFLVSETSAVIWRGLMVMGAIEKLLRQVDWRTTEHLVIDTPPGTGDTLLSLVQNVPISGVVMVTTPQKAAVQVARRGASMLRKLDVPIIGLVANMSSTNCPKCNNQISIFGNEAKTLAEEFSIPLLAEVPLDLDISKGSDLGIPSVISNPNSPQAKIFNKLAEDVIEFLNNKKPF